MSTIEYPIAKPTEPGRYESSQYPLSDSAGFMAYNITRDGKVTYDDGEPVFGISSKPFDILYRLGPFRLLEPLTPKAHTSTVIKTRESWVGESRIVKITSGTKAIGLSVLDDPTPYPSDYKGVTTLTADQAEEIANDLLARVAEIRARGN